MAHSDPASTRPGAPGDSALSWDSARGLLAALSEPAAGEAAEGEFAGARLSGNDPLPALPGFAIKRVLGRGGSGVVYLGVRDRDGSQRPLAIKVFHAGLGGLGSGDAGARRAQRELDLLTQLHLPALPRVIDYGIADGRLYIATEHIEGKPLDEAAAGLSLREKAALLARVADAVQSLHEHGVIHRDLKPGNILIDQGGQPVLIDLGIAALLTGGPGSLTGADTLTTDGAPLGSPAFMAPEQARGERRKMSTRTDVYGLGATAFVVLTGEGPHDGSGGVHDALRRIATQPARRAREVAPGLPRALGAVLDKAVAMRAEERYASAGEFGADLRRWVSGEAVEARSAGAWARGVRWVARHPVAATAALCIIMAAGSAGMSLAGNWYLLREPVALRIVDGGHEAQLVSRAGIVLGNWRADSSGVGSAVQVAALIPLPDGSKGMLLSSSTGREFPEEARASLACFDVSDRALRRPLWSSGSLPPRIEMPRERREPSDHFVCCWAAAADVFPSAPGLEVVALHKHFRYGQCVIRVYDAAAGRVMYEAWHDGSVESPLIVDTAGSETLLIAAACSNAHAIRAGAGGDTTWYGRAVFALRPRPGEVAGWINRAPDHPEPAPPDVAWYEFVHGPGCYEGTRGVRLARWSAQPGASRNGAVMEITIRLVAAGAAGGAPALGAIVIGVGRDGRMSYAHPTDEMDALKGVLGADPAAEYAITSDPPARVAPRPEGFRPWP